MIGKSPNQQQRELFRPLLSDFIDMRHELVLLSNHIDWKYFEKEFASLYSNTGQPALPTRLMVGCLILKQHFRMGQNYLHGDKSPKINALLAAAAWNFKKLMEKIKLKSKNFFFAILQQLFFFEIPKLKLSY